jgi:hypothetical protein
MRPTNDNGDSEIISLQQHILEKEGLVFLCCERCGEDSAFVPVMGQGKDKVLFIALLVCVGANCMGEGTMFDIVNGCIR